MEGYVGVLCAELFHAIILTLFPYTLQFCYPNISLHFLNVFTLIRIYNNSSSLVSTSVHSTGC